MVIRKSRVLRRRKSSTNHKNKKRKSRRSKIGRTPRRKLIKRRKKQTRKRKMHGGVKAFVQNKQPPFDEGAFDILSTDDIKAASVVLTWMEKKRKENDKIPGPDDWKSGEFTFVIYAESPKILYLSPRLWWSPIDVPGRNTSGYGHSSFPRTNDDEYNTERAERTEEIQRNSRRNHLQPGVGWLGIIYTGYYTEGDILLFAGEISFDSGGELISWNNSSGHYRPGILDTDCSDEIVEVSQKRMVALESEMAEMEAGIEEKMYTFHQSLDFDKLLHDVNISEKKNKLAEWSISSVLGLVKAKYLWSSDNFNKSSPPITLLDWLTPRGFAENADTIVGYVTESSALADLKGMLVDEQEDEEEEDLKDLVKEMEIDAGEAARFRAEIETIGSFDDLLNRCSLTPIEKGKLDERLEEIKNGFEDIKLYYEKEKEFMLARYTYKKKYTSKKLSEAGMPLDLYEPHPPPERQPNPGAEEKNEREAIEIWDSIHSTQPE